MSMRYRGMTHVEVHHRLPGGGAGVEADVVPVGLSREITGC
jgi:hypothetical protein